MASQRRGWEEKKGYYRVFTRRGNPVPALIFIWPKTLHKLFNNCSQRYDNQHNTRLYNCNNPEMGPDIHLERGETQNVRIFGGQNGGVLFLWSPTEAGRGSDPRFYVINELLNVQKEIYGRKHTSAHHTCSCSQASVVFLCNATVIYQPCAGASHKVPESRWHRNLWKKTENVCICGRILVPRGPGRSPYAKRKLLLVEGTLQWLRGRWQRQKQLNSSNQGIAEWRGKVGDRQELTLWGALTRGGNTWWAQLFASSPAHSHHHSLQSFLADYVSFLMSFIGKNKHLHCYQGRECWSTEGRRTVWELERTSS